MTDATIKPTQQTPPWRRVSLAVYGALIILFGLGALLAPLLATFAATVTFGAMLIAAGVTGLFTLNFSRRAKGFWWRLLWATAAILGGLCLFFHPWTGALTLTLALGVMLIVQGLVGVGHAIAHRQAAKSSWGWMAAGGVLTALLGALLVWMLPHAGLMIPGLFLAVSLLSFGSSVIAAGYAGRDGGQ
jgi:uncharacterized membrane protein HdeD (DUF308 family)